MSFFGIVVLSIVYIISVLHIMAGYESAVQKNILGIVYNIPTALFYHGLIVWALLKTY